MLLLTTLLCAIHVVAAVNRYKTGEALIVVTSTAILKYEKKNSRISICSVDIDRKRTHIDTSHYAIYRFYNEKKNSRVIIYILLRDYNVSTYL